MAARPLASLLFFCLLLPGPIRAQPPLAEVQRVAARIDQLIEQRWSEEQVTSAPLADDAEYLRRVYLDTAGKIPSVSEVREFLVDDSPTKRQDVVERLLAGPAYLTHFTDKWRNILMPEASSDLQARFLIPAMEAWLRDKLAADVSYADLVRELLTLSLDNRDGRRFNPYANRGTSTPVAFYQAKQIAPENLAAATSRMFLGVRIECAQCHDHPFDDWTRDEFWSFAAFFAGIERTNPEQGLFGPLRELTDRREIGVPDTERVVQAAYLGGGEPQWRFRAGPRDTLAEWITSADNPFFARTAANRLWHHFFGLGLVDPVDDFGLGNPPSHPELLDMLAAEFVSHEFDLKFLIRAITASRTYQLTSERTDPSQADPRLFARMAIKGLTPEQLYNSVLIATGRHEPYQFQRGLRFGGTDPRSEFLELFQNDSDATVETQTTILQALAMMNGQTIASATDLQNSATLTAVVEYPGLTTDERIETLLLATLSRPLRTDERERLTRYVESGGPAGDPARALGDVFWALLNSSEFMFNH